MAKQAYIYRAKHIKSYKSIDVVAYSLKQAAYLHPGFTNWENIGFAELRDIVKKEEAKKLADFEHQTKLGEF